MEEGAYTEEELAELGRLVSAAEDHLQEGEPREAVALAREVRSDFARVPGSGQALWVEARGLHAMGDESGAVDALESYLALLADDPARAGPALLLYSEIASDQGDHRRSADLLLQMPSGATQEDRQQAVERLRREARRLGRSTLEELSAVEAPVPAVAAPLRVELALRLFLAEEEGEAQRLARTVLEGEPDSETRELAEAILEDRLEDALGAAPALAALLPSSGSPSLQRYAEAIREGIEVAVAQARRDGIVVQLEVLDDGGDASRSASLARELAGQNVPIILGPLHDGGLRSAAEEVGEGLFLSPTARILPEGRAGVFSLDAVDPEGPAQLARFALGQGLRTAVVLHPRQPESELEARYFTQAFEEGGGSVVRQVAYSPGTTSFQGPMEEVRQAGPAALALFLPPEEIELVAPQVTYFGIRDLGLQLLGGESWTDEAAVRSTDARHTDGVVTVSSRPAGTLEDWEPYRRFVEEYEDHFQRTLRSSLPALGYDAARLALEGYRRGARTSGELRDVLEGVGEFQGATGLLTVRDGRIVRERRLVRIQDRRFFPVNDDRRR